MIVMGTGCVCGSLLPDQEATPEGKQVQQEKEEKRGASEQKQHKVLVSYPRILVQTFVHLQLPGPSAVSACGSAGSLSDCYNYVVDEWENIGVLGNDSAWF